MSASPAPTRSIADCRSLEGSPVTLARATSTASGASSMTLTEATHPSSRNTPTQLLAIRSASSLLDDGSSVPALTTTSRAVFGSGSPLGAEAPALTARPFGSHVGAWQSRYAAARSRHRRIVDSQL